MKIKTAVVIALLTALMASPAPALEVTWTWTPPTHSASGHELPDGYIAHYVFQIRVERGDWEELDRPTEPSYTGDMPLGRVDARVCAVDIHGRWGVWVGSDPDDPYLDVGPAGGCGVPGWR